MAPGDRIDRFEERVSKIEQKVTETNTQLHEARRDIQDILVTIQGPPRTESIRGRIHRLENSEAAAKAAQAALEAVQAVREDTTDRRLSRAEKKLGLLIAAGLLASNWLAPLIYHHH